MAAPAAAPSQDVGSWPTGPAKEDFLPPPSMPNIRAGDRDLLAQLLLAPSLQARGRLLDRPGNHVFDFNNDTAAGVKTSGRGGSTVAATAETSRRSSATAPP